jgi:hypothetical protein
MDILFLKFGDFSMTLAVQRVMAEQSRLIFFSGRPAALLLGGSKDHPVTHYHERIRMSSELF